MSKIAWIEDVCDAPGVNPNYRKKVQNMAHVLYEALSYVEMLESELKQLKGNSNEKKEIPYEPVAELDNPIVDAIVEEFFSTGDLPVLSSDDGSESLKKKKKGKKNV